MAVLGRVNFAPNQRLDLPDMQAFEAYSGGDWKYFLQGVTGGSPYILSGFNLYLPASLINTSSGTVSVVVASSSLYWPSGVAGSFFVALPTAALETVSLITSSTVSVTNYIEMDLSLSTGATDVRAVWDPGANSGQGGETTQNVDTETFMTAVFSRNSVGFSADKIPIAKVVVNSSRVITSITDCRPLFFRLGSGGSSPDPLHKYSWPSLPSSSFARADTNYTISTAYGNDPFFGADKNITNQKAWMDAVMSRISEIDGTSKWFSGVVGTSAINVRNLYDFSDQGFAPQPTRTANIAWSVGGDNVLRARNTGAGETLKWKMNFGLAQWELGGVITNPTITRTYAAGDYKFSVSVPVDGQNVYILLQKDATLNGDPEVEWLDLGSNTGAAQYRNSSGTFLAGAFTGIAVGDFIKKESATSYEYFQVTELRTNATSVFSNTAGDVADSTVKYVVFTYINTITPGFEKYRFFRKSYSNADLVVSLDGYYNANYFWLGRRVGTSFVLRGYGSMQPGESVEWLASDSINYDSALPTNLVVNHSSAAIYNGSTHKYTVSAGAPATVLTLTRRLSDNTTGNPSAGDNSSSLLAYTLSSGASGITGALGSTLWVRLDDTTGAALAAGDVTDTSLTNRYEFRTAANTPLRVYNNKNVFPIATVETLDGVEVLRFKDGTVLNTNGRVQNGGLQFANYVFDYIPTALLYNMSMLDPQDTVWFSNLGPHTVTLGQSTSTILIPGDLIVLGTTTSIVATNLITRDKNITLNIGNSVVDSGNDSGIEVADISQFPTQYAATFPPASPVVTVTLAGHGYTTETIGVFTSQDCGNITAGEISGTYTNTATNPPTVPGTWYRLDASTILLCTSGASSFAETVSTLNVMSIWLTKWYVKISDAMGASSGITSWSFKVKNVADIITLTPVANYAIIPTAKSTDDTTGMKRTRIPFVGTDGSRTGTPAVDTTFDFSDGFKWDGTTFTALGGIITSGAQVVGYSTKVVSTPYAVASNDYIVPIDTVTPGVAITINLPQVTAGNKGRVIILKDKGGGCSNLGRTITVMPYSGQTVDEYNTSTNVLIMNIDRMALTLVSDGVSAWDLV